MKCPKKLRYSTFQLLGGQAAVSPFDESGRALLNASADSFSNFPMIVEICLAITMALTMHVGPIECSGGG
jgi:hypothetical protein